MVDLYTVMMSVMQMTRMKVDVEEEGDIKHVMVRYQYCCLGKEEGVRLKWAQAVSHLFESERKGFEGKVCLFETY